MSEPYPAPVAQLLALGEYNHEIDYRALGIGAEHIQDLIRLALDEELYFGDEEAPEVWAAIHAWHALAQLGAVEAAEPLTRLFAWLDAHHDDWVASEMPLIFAKLGPETVPVLAAYVQDGTHGEGARIVATEALKEIAARHPEARPDCIEALVSALQHYEDNPPDLNGFLVMFLAELGEVGAAPLMEEAFAADRVSEDVMGDWEDVQAELGLLEERPTPSAQPVPTVKFVNAVKEARRHLQQLGRNDPCWCASGRKYKNCHMREDQQKVTE